KTPGDVAERVASVAGGLRARGVRRGDAVAWQLRNVDEAVLMYRACWRLGAVAVPVHHGMGTADVATALAQVEPRVVLTAPGGAGVTPAFVDQARHAFGAVVKRTYGSTEAPTVTTSHQGDPLDKARDTDGRATGEVELRISTRDAEGEGGELWVRGPELFVGY